MVTVEVVLGTLCVELSNAGTSNGTGDGERMEITSDAAVAVVVPDEAHALLLAVAHVPPQGLGVPAQPPKGMDLPGGAVHHADVAVPVLLGLLFGGVKHLLAERGARV